MYQQMENEQMAKQKNFQKQLWALERLMLPPSYSNYEITKFSVEEWSGGTICVTREYKSPEWKTMAYHQCYKIGPRGAVTEIYSNLY